jgi:hypothetical protein
LRTELRYVTVDHVHLVIEIDGVHR